jgi:gluconokinase
MGVCGTGKSTVAAGLAQALGLDCVDGDDLHSAASVDKMRAGTPLTDADRWPWLDRIGARLCGHAPDGGAHAAPTTPRAPALATAARTPSAKVLGTVVSCSALKRAYRDRLRAAAPGVCFVFLDGAPELIRDRMLARRGHYMPPGLLDSQLKTLERPDARDEPDVVIVSIDASVDEVNAAAAAAVAARSGAGPGTAPT